MPPPGAVRRAHADRVGEYLKRKCLRKLDARVDLSLGDQRIDHLRGHLLEATLELAHYGERQGFVQRLAFTVALFHVPERPPDFSSNLIRDLGVQLGSHLDVALPPDRLRVFAA